jgi:hypothetical protein
MNVPRSTVMQALFNQIAGYTQENWQDYANVPEFVTFGPAGFFRPYAKVPTDQQPALYLIPREERPDQDATGFGLTRWALSFAVIVLFNMEPDQKNPNAAQVALSILDMLDDSLFNNGQPQTLAAQNNNVPLVANAWFDKHSGPIELGLPVLSNQAAIVAPITVLTSQQQPGRRT